MIIETQKDLKAFINILQNNNLTIAEYYYLKALQLKFEIDNSMLESPLSLITLESSGLMVNFIENKKLLTSEGNQLLQKIDNFKAAIVGFDDNFINAYREKFNRKFIGISGKQGDIKSIKGKFTEFFKEFNYDLEVVNKAVDLYIAETQDKFYLMKADNFIYLEQTHNGKKVSTSRLSQYCEDVVAGATINSQERVNKI